MKPRMNMTHLGFSVLFLGLVAGGASLGAQTISGIIAGTVRDQKNTAIPSATVTAANRESGRSYSNAADDNGDYRILELAPGEYDVRAESSGFQTMQFNAVRVSVDKTTHQDFELPIPTQQESVTVVSRPSTAPMTDTSAPTLGMAFSERQGRQLPILTRDVNNLALLAPGVSDTRTFSFASTLVSFAVDGSRGRDNNFIIDSVGNNEPLFGGAATQFTNTDIFAEYTVLTDQMKAEFGRNSGATINAITKSGFASTHGTLFWFGQDHAFNALTQVEKQALLTSPPPSYQNTAGGTLGGPLLKANKEKFLYFISYQWIGALNNLSSVFPVVNTLPTTTGFSTLQKLPQTPALQALLKTPTVSQIPATHAPCFGSTPPAPPPSSGPPPPAPSLTNPCFTTGSPQNSPAGVQFGSYLVPNGNVFNQHDQEASARLDYQISNADALYGRYLFDGLRTPNAALYPAGEVAFSDLGLLSYWRNTLRQQTQNLLLNERHQWVNALNELRFSFTRIAQGIGPFGVPSAASETMASATVADQFGGFGAYSGNFPSAGTQFTLGRDTGPDLTASNIFQVQDNFSYTRRKHSLKFGADFVRTQSNILFVPEDLGHYFFGSAGVAGGLSQFLSEPTGPCATPPCTNAQGVFQRLPNVITNGDGIAIKQGQNELPLREFDQFYFVQDDYRVRPNLTLNLGLRYENFGQPINGMAGLNPAAPHVANDNKNFGPRFGFAWSPSSSRGTVVRGGYTIMYDPMVLNIPLLLWQSGPISPLIQAVVNPPGNPQARTVVQPSGVFPNAPFSLADINVEVQGCNPLHPATDNQGRPVFVPVMACSNQETVDPHLVNPYVQSWSLSVQRSVTPDLLFEIGYVGTKGTKNYQRVDVNPLGGWNPSCLLSGFSYNCLNNRPNPGRGDIQAITNGGLSTYDALQASLTKRTSRYSWGDLSFTGSYTWSHMIDNASEIFGPGVRFIQGNFIGTLQSPETQESVEAVTPLPQSSSDLQAEKGNSSYDRRHRFALSFVWGLPSRRTGGTGALLNGWQLNGIVQVQSGQWFTPLNGVPLGACADANGDGILTNDRPAIGNPAAPADSVALVNDTVCISTNPKTQSPLIPSKPSSTGYVDLDGNPIDPGAARFVQVPLGIPAGGTFLANGKTFVAGSAGRNTLLGPGIEEFDLALYKNFRWGESRNIELRCEVYDVFNHANPGFPLGNSYAVQAQQTFGYALSPRSSAAGVTGVIPENTIDAVNGAGTRDFLSRQYMNTSARRMQFGIRLTF